MPVSGEKISQEKKTKPRVLKACRHWRAGNFRWKECRRNCKVGANRCAKNRDVTRQTQRPLFTRFQVSFRLDIPLGWTFFFWKLAWENSGDVANFPAAAKKVPRNSETARFSRRFESARAFVRATIFISMTNARGNIYIFFSLVRRNLSSKIACEIAMISRERAWFMAGNKIRIKKSKIIKSGR